MNFVREVVLAAPPEARALVERTRDGGRRQYTFGQLADRAARLAGTLAALGVRRGDTVATLIGSRVEWVDALLACFGSGFVALPCNEQLRPADLATRFGRCPPAAVLADERNRAVVEAAAPGCPVLLVPDPSLYRGEPLGPAELDPDDPALLVFTSGTTGTPRAAQHAQRYLSGQVLQVRNWLAPTAGGLSWCTAATGWSKSARNGFVAAWLGGSAALLHDARFDPAERVAVAAEEAVATLCMSPTEYRLVAAGGHLRPLPELRSAVAAGEALDAAALEAWRAAAGVDVRDGYGQTETGQVTANPAGTPPRPGSMGRPLPGVRAWVSGGELLVDPASVPTFFRGYVGEAPPRGPWHTGDLVECDEEGYLYFGGRADDVIVSSGYRIGPFEVESVLVEHPAVAEAAVVAAPDERRGSVVCAHVVLKEGYQPSPLLAQELQAFVRERTAPYKYPRIVEFPAALPKTPSGKIRRAELRAARR